MFVFESLTEHSKGINSIFANSLIAQDWFLRVSHSQNKSFNLESSLGGRDAFQQNTILGPESSTHYSHYEKFSVLKIYTRQQQSLLRESDILSITLDVQQIGETAASLY